MHVFAQKIYDDFVAFNAPKEVWSLISLLESIVIRFMYCNMIVSSSLQCSAFEIPLRL
jgi:hypothetical protein